MHALYKSNRIAEIFKFLTLQPFTSQTAFWPKQMAAECGTTPDERRESEKKGGAGRRAALRELRARRAPHATR